MWLTLSSRITHSHQFIPRPIAAADRFPKEDVWDSWKQKWVLGLGRLQQCSTPIAWALCTAPAPLCSSAVLQTAGSLADWHRSATSPPSMQGGGSTLHLQVRHQGAHCSCAEWFDTLGQTVECSRMPTPACHLCTHAMSILRAILWRLMPPTSTPAAFNLHQAGAAAVQPPQATEC